MHSTVIKTVINRSESAELGLMLAQAEGNDEPLAALYDAFFMYTMQVEEALFTGVLARYDMPDGKHFYTLALTCDGIDSYISSHATVGLVLKHELERPDVRGIEGLKSKLWDNLTQQIRDQQITILRADGPALGDPTDLEMYLTAMMENKDA